MSKLCKVLNPRSQTTQHQSWKLYSSSYVSALALHNSFCIKIRTTGIFQSVEATHTSSQAVRLHTHAYIPVVVSTRTHAHTPNPKGVIGIVLVPDIGVLFHHDE